MRVHIDRFSVGLDDLKRKEQGEPKTVLAVLAKHGRFSCFEASENTVIANTMTWILLKSGWVTTEDIGYPWTKITLTPAGEAALAGKP